MENPSATMTGLQLAGQAVCQHLAFGQMSYSLCLYRRLAGIGLHAGPAGCLHFGVLGFEVFSIWPWEKIVSEGPAGLFRVGTGLLGLLVLRSASY